jgi:cobalamin biosynthesis Mg chelatase CobN
MANPAERDVTDETTDGDDPVDEVAAATPTVDEGSATDATPAAPSDSTPAEPAPAVAAAESTSTKPASKTAPSKAGGPAAAPTKKVVPPKAKAKAKATAATNVRYTAPSPQARRKPSPRWVPILMFALWGVGLLVIILNYMGVMPGGGEDGSGWYLIAGLVSILGGIMVATQYH